MSIERGEDAEQEDEATADDADVEAASVETELSERAELRCGIVLATEDG